MIYYISDIHLGDLKVFNKCHRPFAILEEMQLAIVNNWNKKVRDNDDVYVLGDLVDEDKPAFNASVDVCGFEPKTLAELKLLKGKNKNEPYIN